jgi:hypothetical protein
LLRWIERFSVAFGLGDDFGAGGFLCVAGCQFGSDFAVEGGEV